MGWSKKHAPQYGQLPSGLGRGNARKGVPGCNLQHANPGWVDGASSRAQACRPPTCRLSRHLCTHVGTTPL